MPQEKIDLLASITLLVTGGVTYNVPSMIDVADKYVLFGFHILSALSVFMVAVINRKKFVNDIKSWFK